MQSIFPKFPTFAKYFFNICKYFFNICKVFCQNLLLTLMFLHWAFLVSRFNAKYFSTFVKYLFNIGKVFFQQLQSIFSTFANYSFSKFASIINVFHWAFFVSGFNAKYFFLSVSKQGKSGKYIFFYHYPKLRGGIKLVLKVNQYIHKYWDGSAVWNKGQYFGEKSTNTW